MKNLIHFLQERATGRLVLILFIVTMAVYTIILFYTIPAVLTNAPDMKLFDMSPSGYTLEYAQELLSAIGEAGRQIYLSLQLPVDFIYPGLFAVSYTLLLVWLFKKGFVRESPVFYLALVPFFAGLFDYLENVGIIMMLRTFPDLTPTTVSLASASSVLKSVFTIGFYVLLLVGISAAVRKKWKLADQVIWKTDEAGNE